MIYPLDSKIDKLAARSHRSLESLLLLMDTLKNFSNHIILRHPDIPEMIDKILLRLIYFKEYYVLLSNAFLLPTIEQRNELGKQLSNIPENERNRIDFNFFSNENFDAIDSFFTSYAHSKIEQAVKDLSSFSTYSIEEARKDLAYIVS